MYVKYKRIIYRGSCALLHISTMNLFNVTRYLKEPIQAYASNERIRLKFREHLIDSIFNSLRVYLLKTSYLSRRQKLKPEGRIEFVQQEALWHQTRVYIHNNDCENRPGFYRKEYEIKVTHESKTFSLLSSSLFQMWLMVRAGSLLTSLLCDFQSESMPLLFTALKKGDCARYIRFLRDFTAKLFQYCMFCWIFPKEWRWCS